MTASHAFTGLRPRDVGPEYSLVARRLFDGSELIHSDGVKVTIHDGVVTEIEPVQEGESATDDLTILPGLIDVHSHLSLSADGSSYETMALNSDLGMFGQAVHNCARHLAVGVTTLRDNGSRGLVAFAVRDAVNAGMFPGPTILASGPPVTPTGGHFTWCGGSADGEEGVTAAVRRLLHEGADFIKIMASGGGTSGTRPGRPGYTLAEIGAIVAAAVDLGMLTTAHCRATEGIERAVRSGVNCIEHAEFVGPDNRVHFNPRVANLLAGSEAFVSPTMQAFGHYRIPQLLEAKRTRQLTPEEAGALDRLQTHLDDHIRTFGRLLDMLGPDRMVYGSDAGPGYTSFGDVEFGLRLMHQGGMTPIDVLRSVTSSAARAIGVDRGMVVRGSRADLVVVRGDPTSQLEAVRDVVSVIQAGAVVHVADSGALEHSLAQPEVEIGV